MESKDTMATPKAQTAGLSPSTSSPGYLLPSNREIELRCPTCGLTVMTPVQPYDPPQAARMEDWCPECVSGGFGHPVYFDVDGMEIDESDAADNMQISGIE